MNYIKNLSKRSSLARNTIWSLAGLGFRIVLQAGYFIFLARLLGIQDFGAFVGVAAIVTVLSQFSGLGIGNLLIKNVARHPQLFHPYWGNSILLTLVTSALLIPISMIIGRLLWSSSIPTLFILLIALSDILFLRIIENSAQAFQAFQRLKWTAFINIQISFTKMIAVVALSWMIPSPNLWSWGVAYLGSTLISAFVAVILVHRKLGTPSIELIRIMSELKEGLYFSFGGVASGVHNESDKSLLTLLSSLEAVGIYGAANRIIEVSFTPIRSILLAAYAQFFQLGERGLLHNLRFSTKIIPILTIYGVICGALLYTVAPILPIILGNDFRTSAEALRWLAFIPLLKSFHYLAADSLAGAGYQRYRTLVQVAVVVLSIVTNLILIPIWGWKGAALTAIFSHALFACLLWIRIFVISFADRHPIFKKQVANNS